MKFLLEKVPHAVAKYMKFIIDNGILDAINDTTDIENSTARELSWDEFLDYVNPDAGLAFVERVMAFNATNFYMFEPTDYDVTTYVYDRDNLEDVWTKTRADYEWNKLKYFKDIYDLGTTKIYLIKTADIKDSQRNERNDNDGYRTKTGHHTYKKTKKSIYDDRLRRAADMIANINDRIESYNKWYLDGETDRETYIAKIRNAEKELKHQEMNIVKAYNEFKTKDPDRYKKQSDLLTAKRDEVKDLIHDIRTIERDIEDYKERIQSKEDDLAKTKDRMNTLIRRR